MSLVLSRRVTADGVPYAEGTPLEQIPKSHQESVLGAGWTREAVAEVVAEPSVQTDEGATAADVEPVETIAVESVEEKPDASESVESTEDSPSLLELPINDRLKELLVEAKLPDGRQLETVSDVQEFGRVNGGWRVIKGIAKAGNAEIEQALAAFQ